MISDRLNLVMAQLSQFIYDNYLLPIDAEKPAPNLIKAEEFYRRHLFEDNKSLEPVLRRYNFKSQIPPWKFEVFAAIVVGDIGSGKGTGADLSNHEVKSALNGCNFEYQYHRKSWKEKLYAECKVDHIFISYEPGVANLDMRVVAGKDLASYFLGWESEIERTYKDNQPNSRFRKTIQFKTVVELGNTILQIRDGHFRTATLFGPRVY